MDTQRFFLATHRDYDELLSAVQKMCAEQFIKDATQLGSWTLEIEQHSSTRWWCVYIKADFELWVKIAEPKGVGELACHWLMSYLDNKDFSDAENEISNR